MKKLLALVLSASAIAAMADVVGSNEIGTLEITSTLKNTVVAVPFGTLGASVDTIKPSDLVLTTGLTAGDQLYVFKDGAYQAWLLESSGWSPVANSSIGTDGLPTATAGSADTTVNTGSGFWLVRGSSYEEGTSFKFYVYGEYKENVISTIIPGANLIANPLDHAVAPVFTGTPADGDTILVPQSGVLPLRYTYRGGNWKHNGSATELPAFVSGQGAWYIYKGTGSLTCTWN